MAITKIFEIIDKGRGIIEELTPENLLLLKDGGGGAQTLSETLDNGNVTGGFNILINDADAIELENTSLLKKGTYDFGGDGGISRICSVGFEDMWQSGFRHVFDNNGLIRHSTNCFDVIPDETFDDTLRFKIDSLWTLDNGTTYKCLDASTGAAIWELYSVGGIPTLQEVLDNNHDLVDGIFNAGTGAGDGNTGISQVAIGTNAGGLNSGENQNALGQEAGIENQGRDLNALGYSAGNSNSGNDVNALGQQAGSSNTGNSLNALGSNAGESNLGSDVNAFGYNAGFENTYNNVNLFGQNAEADENGQTVLSKDGTIMARISTADLTDTHKYNLPDADGTIALTSDIPAAVTPTLQEVLDNNHDLVDGNFFVGTLAGDNNVGTYVIGIGDSALRDNTTDYIVAIGSEAGFENTGAGLNALGVGAGYQNSGDNVVAIGLGAGIFNTYNYVNLFGTNATADENGQTVLSKDDTIMARISTADLTDTHKYNLPDADGTIALTSDIPTAVTPTLQEVTDAGAITTADIEASSFSSYSTLLDFISSFNYTGLYVLDLINLTISSEYLLNKIKNNGVEYALPTGVTSPLATLDDIPTNTSDLVNDGEDGTSPYVTADQLPSNLNLFATNVSSDIATYFKLVTSIDDPDYNDTAVDIPTGAITTTGQFIAALATTANVLVGNPGIINLLTIGNVRRTAGTGTAEFYYEVYHRTSGGTETLIATSSNTIPVSAAIYTEFLAAALLNNGVFLATDRIVVKYYANRIAGGSNPSYDFQFGGASPVRTTFPVPASNIPLDATPTSGSTNGVQSNGVFDALALKADKENNYFLSWYPTGSIITINNYTSAVSSTAFSSTTSNSNNLTKLQPFVTNKTITIDELYLSLATANNGTGSTATLYIFDDSNDGLPGVKLHQEITATGIFTAGNSIISFTNNITLQPGVYWIGIHIRDLNTAGTNPTFYHASLGGNTKGYQTAGISFTNNYLGVLFVGATTGDLGNNPTILISAGTNLSVPMLKIKLG